MKLARDASGLRHLRWAREILATLEAHAAHDPTLGDAQRAALGVEIATLTGLVDALSGAVKPYRDFLERVRVKGRGRTRVGAYLCIRAMAIEGAEATMGSATADTEERLAERARDCAEALGLEERGRRAAEASALLKSFLSEARSIDEPRREALGRSLDQAITALRRGLDAMDERLRDVVPPGLIENVYPPVTPDGSRVADSADRHDDASASR